LTAHLAIHGSRFCQIHSLAFVIPFPMLAHGDIWWKSGDKNRVLKQPRCV
jgi:hypothetical protein